MSSGAPSGQDVVRADDGRFQQPQGLSRPMSGQSPQANPQSHHAAGRTGEGNMDFGESGGLSMGHMGSSLPNYRPNQAIPVGQSVSRVPSGTIPNLNTAQHQQQHPSMLTFAGQTQHGGQNQNHAQQYMQPYPHMQHAPMSQQGFGSGAQGQPGFHGGYPPQHFSSQPFQPSQQQLQSPVQPYMFYQPTYGQMSPTQGYQGPRQSPGGYPHGASFPSSVNLSGIGGHGQTGQPGISGPRYNNNTPKAPIPSAPRGPPRKPKQSGYALWVGNLPPGALVQDLKDHFSRDATNDIESVFLISKSNCAFVNYRTEPACAAAMTRFHDSRFQGVRLVCRYRSAAAATSTSVTPSGPAAQSPTTQQSQTAIDAIAQNREVSSKAEETMRQQHGATKVNDKYFVVKSLTVEDLELSARNGIWATQAHNEEALNKAFESVENVYLVFSANKSGEYFGYARMISQINDESASKLDWKPRQEVFVDDPELPRSIPTPATETAPKGRIIDDSARGTIFWEVDTSDEESDGKDEPVGAAAKQSKEPTPEDSPGQQTFGRPFKIEWVSTDRVPFYRTRGLRNPWNGNRDVKIARDGTELETSVGRRLIQMFHRTAGAQQSTSPGMLEQPMVYPPMSPF